MLIEVDRFIEFNDGYFRKMGTAEPLSLGDLVLKKITLNTDYITWMQRYEMRSLDATELGTADRGPHITVMISYEEMKALLDVKVAA